MASVNARVSRIFSLMRLQPTKLSTFNFLQVEKGEDEGVRGGYIRPTKMKTSRGCQFSNEILSFLIQF